MSDISAEQQARDLLEQCGVEDAQSFTAGDVVALANFIADANARHGKAYDSGYSDGYESGVRDAQIELRGALADLQGARKVTIHGYDTEAKFEGTALPTPDESIFRSGGQTYEYGPRPHISTRLPNA